MARLRDHPRFFLAVALVIGVLVFASIFEFFTGLLGILLGGSTPILLPIERAEALGPPGGLPPIAIFAQGDPFRNSTYLVSSNGAQICWEYWYFWPPSSVHPANDWEPVYVYWDLSGLLTSGPSLLAIGVRLHFAWRLVFPPITLNLTKSSSGSTIGIQPYVTFSPGFHIPTIKTTLIGRLLTPPNSTVLYNYPIVQDPSSPPSTGPNAYEQSQAGNAQPIDPWVLYGGLAAYQGGIVWGSIGGGSASLFSYSIVLVTIHPKATRRRVRIRKRLLPAILED